MTLHQRPPVSPQGRPGRTGDLDGLLETFFRTEMPNPWPQWQAPVQPQEPSARQPARQRGRTLVASRFVLAASLLLLLIGHLALTALAPEPAAWPSDPAGDRYPAQIPGKQRLAPRALPGRAVDIETGKKSGRP